MKKDLSKNLADCYRGRAPVQGDCVGCDRGPTPAGTVSWSEHVEAWSAYHELYPRQTAERIAERGGFSYWEIADLLGRKPTTWEIK